MGVIKGDTRSIAHLVYTFLAMLCLTSSVSGLEASKNLHPKSETSLALQALNPKT